MVSASAVSPAAADPDDDSDLDRLHPSWSIYSQPGNPCVICSGGGVVKCLYCFGEGVIRVGPEVARDTRDCPQCRGSGSSTCIRCDGSGIRPDTREDPITGEILRNFTNEEINRPKEAAELEEEEEERIIGEEDAVRGNGAVRGSASALREDGLVGESRHVGKGEKVL